MFKKLSILFIALSVLFFISCGGDGGKESDNSNANQPIVKKDIAPIADNEIAVIEMENQAAFGTIKIELYSNVAPKMVEQFKTLAKEGFYNGVTFHRINDKVIQSGDPLSKDADPLNDGMGGSEKPDVEAEFSDVPYDIGIVGAARAQDPNSANSQFFITLKRVPDFDEQYTIFGKVIEGMNNVRTISGVTPREGERPLEPIRIKSITIQPK